MPWLFVSTSGLHETMNSSGAFYHGQSKKLVLLLL
jgi:hypothetical protein